MTRMQRKYDHRLRDLVRSTGDIGHAVGRGVPLSTARGWLNSPCTEVFTIDFVDGDVLRLQQEVLALHKRVERLSALLRILVVLLKVSGFSLSRVRLPDGASNRSVTFGPSVASRSARSPVVAVALSFVETRG